LKWEKGKLGLAPPSTTAYFVKMWKTKGLPRVTFCYHEMVEMEEEKGLLRASFNYNTFCKNAGMEGAASNHI